MFKVIFADLDDTLIKTASGKTFAEDPTDFRIKKDVLDAIKNIGSIQYIFIITNQGGIPEYISLHDFETKLKTITTFINGYTRIPIEGKFCTSKDPAHPRRKPNTGMLDECWRIFYYVRKEECLMIGDASGKPGDFSDSDKKTAENFGIAYMDVDDFVKEFGKE